MFGQSSVCWKTAKLLAAALCVAWLEVLPGNIGVHRLFAADAPEKQEPAPQGAAENTGRTPPVRRPDARAVASGLHWLARHQMDDGSWSLQRFTDKCKDKTCTGRGSQESLAAATAMSVLPFLAAGQTHVSAGPFNKTVSSGIEWLRKHQTADGDLSADAPAQMYSHGLATIALCECYGMSGDKTVGAAAQRAIGFIEQAQNKDTGGWRYHPGDDGDTSVFAWQMMALKSAQLAKLDVKQETLERARKWLQSVTKKAADETALGQFSYQPDGGATPSMSAAGLLCSQYLGATRTDPTIIAGVKFLTSKQPDEEAHNVYYWFFGTEILHYMQDRDWDAWNRKLRNILVYSQVRDGCAAGSWDPDKPSRDAWGSAGGRVMMTSFSCLALEVYYRYLPLYKLDRPEDKAASRGKPEDKHSNGGDVPDK